MRKTFRLVILAAVILGGVLFLNSNAQAVTISQYTLEIVARPGDTIELVNQLYDDALTGVRTYPWIYNFAEDPDIEGSPIILTDPADLKPDRQWIKYDTTLIELPADGSLVDFPYRIEVPKDAEPGTHLISIVYRTQAPKAEEEDGSIVYIGTNIATNIFLKVLGATIDELAIDFQSGIFTNKDTNLSPDKQKDFFEPKTFFLKPPVDFLLTVNNTGNTHQKPDGNVKMFNDLWGGKQADKLSVNSENKIVLPGSDRTYAVPSFGQGFMIGKFRAKITLLYGDPLRSIDEEIVFWIVPLKEILIALAILIIIILLIWFFRRRRKKKDLAEKKSLRDEFAQVIDEKLGKSPPTGIPGVPPTPPQTSAADAMTSGKKKKKALAVVLISIGSLALLAGGYFSFLYFASTEDTNSNASIKEEVNTNEDTSTNDAKTSTNTNTAANINTSTNANTNSDTNTNVETNTNTDTNTESNVNTEGDINANTNADINTNADTNTNTDTNANSNANVNTAPPIDTDGDGLNDLDEAIYGTDPLNPDTDGDGFLDGSEVRDGFNPNGEGSL